MNIRKLQNKLTVLSPDFSRHIVKIYFESTVAKSRSSLSLNGGSKQTREVVALQAYNRIQFDNDSGSSC